MSLSARIAGHLPHQTYRNSSNNSLHKRLAPGVHSTSYALRQCPEPTLKLVSHLGVSKAQKQVPRSSQTPKTLHPAVNSQFKTELLAPPAARRVQNIKKQL